MSTGNYFQRTMPTSPSAAAIEVRNLHLTYGSQLKPVPVLKSLSMAVPRGSIYGLLGASGCGKTSLIRCILGTLKFNAGEITVFGERPGSAASSVPGAGVGYMPQDITLYEELTTAETLRYFGSLYGMARPALKERSAFLVDFLDLPDPHRLIRYLSGGQRRRVSLAAALIHQPPLLVLDEPTVGVDPILRQSIWSHLIELSEKKQLTVLITTHYIEEARDAHQIGLMRHGQMLAADSPKGMLAHYGLPSLEAVFLHLCTKADADRDHDQTGPQVLVSSLAASMALPPPPGSDTSASNSSSRRGSTASSSSGTSSSGVVSLPDSDGSKCTAIEVSTIMPVTHPQPSLACKSTSATKSSRPSLRPGRKSKSQCKSKSSAASISWCSQVGAMLVKNVTANRRNATLMLFQFMMPTIQVILFCACIGLNLHSIPVAVYDGDQSPFSQRILATLNSEVITQTAYDSPEEAVGAVRNGYASTALTMYGNFSDYLYERVLSMGLEIAPEVLYNSTIHLHPDMSNRLMVLAVQEEVTTVFLRVGQSFLEENGLSPALLEMPVRLEAPIYGLKNSVYRDYAAPGTILSIAFLSAIPLTAMVLVVERKQGLIERSIVAGASYLRILVALLLPQILILFVSSLSLLIFVFPVFGVSYQGHFSLILLMTFLQSISGMCFGVLVSTLAKDENSATMLALSFFYPNLMLSGTVWPVEAMANWVQSIAYYLPQTLPINAMRLMVSRGWSIFRAEVVCGFAVTAFWSVLFLLASALAFKLRKL